MSVPARPFLMPLVPLYRVALGLHELGLRSGLQPVRRLQQPVVSIGSLSAGGAGKTPLTIALAQALTHHGLRVDVLSRGYGRHSRLAVRVDPEGVAEDFGDEPLLIAREAGVPVYVAERRYEAGLIAERDACADLHLLDDGFQHRQLRRDLNIVLLDRHDWSFDRLLPAGNLREPISALRRASVLAIPADEEAAEFDTALYKWGWDGSIWRLHRRIEVPAIDCAVAAFCGIARPAQFFSSLESAGLQIAARIAFPDHYRYMPNDLDRLLSDADRAGARALLTTEKDFVRLGKLAGSFPAELPLKTVRLRTVIEDEAAALKFFAPLLESARERG